MLTILFAMMMRMLMVTTVAIVRVLQPVCCFRGRFIDIDTNTDTDQYLYIYIDIDIDIPIYICKYAYQYDTCTLHLYIHIHTYIESLQSDGCRKISAC